MPNSHVKIEVDQTILSDKEKLSIAKEELRWMTDFSSTKSITTLALNVSQSMGLILMILKGIIHTLNQDTWSWLNILYLISLCVALSLQVVIGQFYFYFHKSKAPKNSKERETVNSYNYFTQQLAYATIYVNAVILGTRYAMH